MQRALLDSTFLAWTCVVELHKDGRPHFHILVASKENLRAGYDFEALKLAKEIKYGASSQRRSMNSSEVLTHRRLIADTTERACSLQSVWKPLRKRLPHYSFGRAYPGTLECILSAEGIALAGRVLTFAPSMPTLIARP